MCLILYMSALKVFETPSLTTVLIDSMNVHRKFEIRIALAVPEIIAIGVLVRGCEP